MRIAIVAPSPVPFQVGGAEHLWWALQSWINRETGHACELIKLPSPEGDLVSLIDSYRRFSALDLSAFDVVISSKYPAWMIDHPHHVCYMLHRLRGLYDTWNGAAYGETYAKDHPAVRAIESHMGATAGRREGLPGFFDAFDALRDRRDLPDGLLAFPGPFAKRIVHYLDGIGLAPDRIRRFAAISKTVAARKSYFPPGAQVAVLHPPSNIEGLGPGRADYLFTVSRLDGPKRVGLIVEGFRRTDLDVKLRIAGTGPEHEKLEAMAAGDSRIEFLGYVADRDLAALYRDAIAVPFVPYDEDYGYITIEAMLCAKPVVTCADSGGPNEFVEDGVTGYCVAPDARAIGHALAKLVRDPDAARIMGSRARERVRAIAWKPVVAGLLGEAPGAIASRAPRRKVVVAATFPVYPPRGGGQSRIFHLYRELARTHDVTLLTFTEPGEAAFDAEIAPGLREVRTPMSAAHREAEDRIRKACGFLQITDIAMPELWTLTPDWVASLERAAADAELFIASHPYLFPALETVAKGRPIAHESQDVEIELKTQILPGNAESRRLLESVRAVERDCCRKSTFILACTDEEARKLASLYGVTAERFVIAPNGADVEATTFTTWDARRATATRMGITTPVALFVGSWHGPNVDALKAIYAMAGALPSWAFVAIGSVCQAMHGIAKPANVALMGVVDDATKAVLYETASAALNPMATGTGTNLKMLDYLAAGIPALTTPWGARGLELVSGRHCVVADLAGFPAALEKLGSDPGLLDRMTRLARAHVEARFDWRRIAERAFARASTSGVL